MIRNINLKDKTLNWMGRKQIRSAGRGTFWASESSAAFINEFNEREVVGKCHRATFYRLTDVEPTNPPTAKSEVLFELGHQIESTIVELWKQMGVWENNSVRWEDKAKNLSGEMDVILKEHTPEGLVPYGAEVKSFYGYYANKQILGDYAGRGKNRIWVPGKPKDEHLMQTSIYADQMKDKLHGFKLFYISRDNCAFGEFNIEVNEAGEIFVDGVVEPRFKMEDIYTRYAELQHYIDNNLKPAREFTYKPSDEAVKLLHERGRITPTVYKKHTEKKEAYTDWHCRYCDYCKHCTEVDTE